MTRLRDFQNAFIYALEHGDDTSLTPHFREEDVVIKNRFSIYRNNVIYSLTEALKAAYPVVAQLVGDEFFSATARVWLKDNMPQQASLVEFGDAFPEFLDGFEPAQAIPYLSAVARLERARLQANNAADATPLDPVVISQISPEDLPAVIFRLHPSLRMETIGWPAHLIWDAHHKTSAGGYDTERTAEALATLNLKPQQTHLVIIRPHLRITMGVVDEGTMVLLRQFSQGEKLQTAAEVAHEATTNTGAPFNLSVALQDLWAKQVFTGFHKDRSSSP
ncbi:MAG: DNA-binding domain-containing protein [Parvularculales bacterium]